MAFNPNSLSTNILVTILNIVMVIMLPLIDHSICKKIGVSLSDCVSSNPKADKILHLRKRLLIAVFGLYLLLVAYVAFFSRSASDDYRVHIALYHDLASSIKIDLGIFGFIHTMFTEGFNAAMSHVEIRGFASIAQVYMNICMFIPMGYLLPYVFDWFRRRPKGRTILACFIISFLVENLQLITKLGFYDADDLISNVIGGVIGAYLYVSFAYVLAHPDWRTKLKEDRLWRKNARKKALYPFFKRIHVVRSTVLGTDKLAVLDFYVNKLGMHLSGTYEKKDEYTACLFQLGRQGNDQIEVRCNPNFKGLGEQNITIACNNSEYLKRSLKESGVETSEYAADPFSGLRTFTILAPDNVKITIIEE